MSADHDLVEDEGTGYLISVSDMMAGLLFIFIITLVAFILHFQQAQAETQAQQEKLKQEAAKLREQEAVLREKIKEQDQIVGELTNSNDLRAELLTSLKRKLEAANVQVEVDTQHGVLRLSEKAIRFESAKDTLDAQNLSNLKIVGDVLSEVLPCYASNPPTGDLCLGKEMYNRRLDSVFVEGHTDNVPISSSVHFNDNWDLSAQRAIRTFRLLVPPRKLLNDMNNTNAQPIFSVSGYGEGRPVAGHKHESATNDVANRRIDLRFIMTPPSLVNARRAVRAAEASQ